MNAAVNHIMQTTDWTKYSLEEWLYQFGAWMYSNSGTWEEHKPDCCRYGSGC